MCFLHNYFLYNNNNLNKYFQDFPLFISNLYKNRFIFRIILKIWNVALTHYESSFKK